MTGHERGFFCISDGPNRCSHAVESILPEAHELVHGARQQDYGHPLDDFACTGRIWGALLGIPDVPPEKVALCLIAMKLSRESRVPKRDNRVDIAGYAETAEMIEGRLRRD